MSQYFVLFVTVITALACALVGNFLVLKKLSLLGDAMSHVVLPGIIVAFLLLGTLDSPLFFLFAVLFCLLMTFLIEWFSRTSIVREESAIGVVFTSLFAAGILLLVRFANNVHLDQDAVLYGQVEFSGLKTLSVGGVVIGPTAFWIMLAVFLLDLAVLLFIWKELRVSTFDPQYSNSVGLSSRIAHYILITLTSITIVAAFESVGAILVVALLIVPPATAYIYSKSLLQMVIHSLLYAVMASIGGYILATAYDTSISGAVATFSGLLLIIIAVVYRISLRISRRKASFNMPS
jgi:manganese/zinc/iron transport system permease protein